jgi:hypothetical protein
LHPSRPVVAVVILPVRLCRKPLPSSPMISCPTHIGPQRRTYRPKWSRQC